MDTVLAALKRRLQAEPDNTHLQERIQTIEERLDDKNADRPRRKREVILNGSWQKRYVPGFDAKFYVKGSIKVGLKLHINLNGRWQTVHYTGSRGDDYTFDPEDGLVSWRKPMGYKDDDDDIVVEEANMFIRWSEYSDKPKLPRVLGQGELEDLEC